MKIGCPMVGCTPCQSWMRISSWSPTSCQMQGGGGPREDRRFTGRNVMFHAMMGEAGGKSGKIEQKMEKILIYDARERITCGKNRVEA